MKTRLLYVAAWGLAAMLVIGLRAQALLQPEPPAFTTGILRVAIDPSYPPFAGINGDEVAGLDVDVANALGETLDLPVDRQLLGVDALYDALRDRRVDVIISTIQPENWRTGDVRYSRPYFDAGLVLVGDAAITTMQDLPGHTLAYAFGSEADAEARVWSRRIEAFETRPYELPAHALDAARLGEADVALVDAITAYLYLQDHPEWDIDLHYSTHRPFVVAVHIDDWGSLRAVNEALDTLDENGTLDDIIARWLG